MKTGVVAAALAVGISGSGLLQAQTLKEAVAQSIESYPDVQIVQNQLFARREAVGIARSGFLPQVDIAMGLGEERTDNVSNREGSGTHDRELGRGEMSLTLTQMFYDGNRTEREVQRSRAEARAHQDALIAEAENAALSTVDAYLGTLLAEQVLALSEENFQSHLRIYEQINLRTEQGLGTSSELAQVEGRLARAKSNQIAAENNLLDSQAAFLRVVGVEPVDLQDPRDTLPAMPVSLAKARRRALENHPTLQSALHDISAAAERVKVTESAFRPDVRVEVGGNWNDDVDGVDGHSNDLTAMLRVRYNLFSGNRDTYRQKEALHQLEEAKDIHLRARRQVEEGLSLAWNAYRSLSRQRIFLKQHVDASVVTLDAYLQQFEVGRRSLMDLLDTENELFEARKAALEADKDWLYAQYRVLNAMGDLLGSMNINTSQLVASAE